MRVQGCDASAQLAEEGLPVCRVEVTPPARFVSNPVPQEFYSKSTLRSFVMQWIFNPRLNGNLDTEIHATSLLFDHNVRNQDIRAALQVTYGVFAAKFFQTVENDCEKISLRVRVELSHTSHASPTRFPRSSSATQAIGYAICRVCFRRGEIRILDSKSGIECIIPFDGSNRRL
jgi:hypothetical protein